MATMDERMGVVETKVEHLNEKLDELKVDVKDLHDCLDRTRDSLEEKLETMLIEYRENRDRYYQVLDENKEEARKAHNDLYAKLEGFEKLKTKVMISGIAVAAFLAGTGYLTHGEVGKIIKLLAG
jgi:predicted RNase H-like nuclease (RuvC/YqgF family)